MSLTAEQREQWHADTEFKRWHLDAADLSDRNRFYFRLQIAVAEHLVEVESALAETRTLLDQRTVDYGEALAKLDAMTATNARRDAVVKAAVAYRGEDNRVRSVHDVATAKMLLFIAVDALRAESDRG